MGARLLIYPKLSPKSEASNAHAVKALGDDHPIGDADVVNMIRHHWNHPVEDLIGDLESMITRLDSTEVGVELIAMPSVPNIVLMRWYTGHLNRTPATIECNKKPSGLGWADPLRDSAQVVKAQKVYVDR